MCNVDAANELTLFLSEVATVAVLQEDILKNFSKLTGKHLCRSLFFDIKMQTLCLHFY